MFAATECLCKAKLELLTTRLLSIRKLPYDDRNVFHVKLALIFNKAKRDIRKVSSRRRSVGGYKRTVSFFLK